MLLATIKLSSLASASASKFDPFNCKYDFELSPTSASFVRSPWGPPQAELHHPRPQRRVALANALAHFEEVAPRWKDAHRISSRMVAPIHIADLVSRFEDPYAPKKVDTGVLSALQRVVEARMLATADDAAPQVPPTSSGLACLSPGFLDHFPNHGPSWMRAPRPEDLPQPAFSLSKARAAAAAATAPRCFFPPPPTEEQPAPQSACAPLSPGLACLSPGFLDHFGHSGGDWVHPPRPEDLPQPTFSLALARANAAVSQLTCSVPNSIQTIPSQYTSDAEAEETPRTDNELLSLMSALEARLAFAQTFEGEGEDDAYYTASEGSNDSDSAFDDEEANDADDEASDDEAAVCSWTARRTDGNSASSPAQLKSSSRSDSFSSTSTAACSQSALNAPGSKTDGKAKEQQQLRWTFGMPGDALTFLLAAEHEHQLTVKAKAEACK